MTVQSTNSRTDVVASAGATVINLTFFFMNDTDLQVYKNDVLQTTGFTIDGAGRENPLGTVTFTTALDDGDRIAVVRIVPVTQLSDFELSGRFPSEVAEDALDKLTHIDQQQDEEISRCFKTGPSSTVTDVLIESPTDSDVGKGMVIRGSEAAGFTVGYSTENFDEVVDTIRQDVTRAETAATNAEASASSASTSATASAGSATDASNSASAAAASAASAAQSVIDAQAVVDNAEQASETQAGLIEISTQEETNTGSNDTTAITPLKLSNGPAINVNNLLHYNDERASNTAGGTLTSGSWEKRDLNTEKRNTISGASVSNSVITLPAGSYYADGCVSGYRVDDHRARLRDTTSNSDILLGISARSGASDSTSTDSFFSGYFTLGVESTLEVQHRCQTTRSSDGRGQPSNFGVAELYLNLKIWKVG